MTTPTNPGLPATLTPTTVAPARQAPAVAPRRPRRRTASTTSGGMPTPWGDSAALFDRIVIAGVAFEGEFELDLGEVWKKKSDHRRARGRNGGTSTATGWDRVEFGVTLYAHDEVTFAAQLAIQRRLVVRNPTRQDATAVILVHPEVQNAGISQVTFESGGIEPVKAGGKRKMTLKFKEYAEPSARSTTRTPTAAAQGESRQVSTVARDEDGRPISYGPPTPITMVPIPPPAPSSGPGDGVGGAAGDGFGGGPGA